MRRNLVLFILIVVLVSVAFFFLVWRPQAARITEAEQQAETTERQVEQVELEIARLKALRDRAPELRQEAAKLDTALPGDPQLAQFILQVQEAANASGIDWLSINPTPPAAGPGGQPGAAPQDVLVVQISMQITGGYFQVQDFLVRLENLSRAVRIETISLSPTEEGLSSALIMKMFVAPPAPAPAPSPTPVPAG